MIDIFLLVIIILLSLILIITNIYLLAYYCHPDDRGFGSGLLCKLIVIIGMTLSWAQVLMLPLDVANIRGNGGEIRMDMLWQIMYISLATMVIVVIPTCSYYYEADPEWTIWEKIKYSFCYLLATIIIVLTILIVSYSFLSTAEIPISTINCSITNIQSSNSIEIINFKDCLKTNTFLEIDVSFPIYVIGILSFVSWFLFVLFGGIGIPALPLDFIYDFCNRPKKMSRDEIEKRKNKIVQNATHLRDLGREIKLLEQEGILKKTFLSKDKREYNDKIRRLKAGVILLDKEYEYIQVQTDLNDSWVLHYYIGLVLGFITLLIALALVYIIVKINGQPVYGMLNNLLLYLTESNVSFLSTGIFGIFCLYLLWATIKGNLKFGLRIFFFFNLHPMKKNETYMNSFLFNVVLILLASVSVTQFCSIAFQEYSAMTDIDLIFSSQIKYLKFFSYFYKHHIFEYSLFGIIILSTLYLLIRPSDINSINSILARKRDKRSSLALNEESI